MGAQNQPSYQADEVTLKTLSDGAFVEDLTTVFPTHISLERKMDIVSAFAIVLSLLVTIAKLKLLRTPGRSEPLPPHLVIRMG